MAIKVNRMKYKVLIILTLGVVTCLVIPKDYVMPTIPRIAYYQKTITATMFEGGKTCMEYSWYTPGKVVDRYHQQMECDK